MDRKHFLPVSCVDSPEDLVMKTFSIDRKGNYSISIWSLLAIGILSISNILYMVAMLTNGWGTVDIEMNDGSTDHWDFGLYQCCRESDGLCIGPRWPSEYFNFTIACVPNDTHIIILPLPFISCKTTLNWCT